MNPPLTDVLARDARKNERAALGHATVPMTVGAVSGVIVLAYGFYHTFHALVVATLAKAN